VAENELNITGLERVVIEDSLRRSNQLMREMVLGDTSSSYTQPRDFDSLRKEAWLYSHL